MKYMAQLSPLSVHSKIRQLSSEFNELQDNIRRQFSQEYDTAFAVLRSGNPSYLIQYIRWNTSKVRRELSGVHLTDDLFRDVLRKATEGEFMQIITSLHGVISHDMPDIEYALSRLTGANQLIYFDSFMDDEYLRNVVDGSLDEVWRRQFLVACSKHLIGNDDIPGHSYTLSVLKYNVIAELRCCDVAVPDELPPATILQSFKAAPNSKIQELWMILFNIHAFNFWDERTHTCQD